MSHAINKSANVTEQQTQKGKLLLSTLKPAHTALDTYRISTKFTSVASCPNEYLGTDSPSLLSLCADAAIKPKIQAAAIRVVYHCFPHVQGALKKEYKPPPVEPTDQNTRVRMNTSRSASQTILRS
jgi:hypothetical protein